MIRNLAQAQNNLQCADLYSSCEEEPSRIHQKQPVQDQRSNAAAPVLQIENPSSIIAQILPSRDHGESTYSQVSIGSLESQEPSQKAPSISSDKSQSEEQTKESLKDEMKVRKLPKIKEEYYVFMRQLPHLEVPGRLEYYALSKKEDAGIIRILLYAEMPLKILQWHLFSHCQVAAKNVVICRGKYKPLKNRGNPTIDVPALSVNSRVYEICSVKLKFAEEDLKMSEKSDWFFAKSDQLPEKSIRIHLLFKEGITGPPFPVSYSCCAILASKTGALNLIEIPPPLNLD